MKKPEGLDGFLPNDQRLSQEYMDYLRSDTWQKKRSLRLKIDHYQCQGCGTTFSLDVHHLQYPETLGTEDVYKDMITLCRKCHELIEEEKRLERQRIEEYHNQQRERWEQEKQERRERNQHHKTLIRQFIDEHKHEDLSNIGIGKKNYCDLDIIKQDFYPWMRQRGAEEFEDGYISGVNIVQDYFRNRKYEIILDMREKGYSPWDIHCRTLFTMKMIRKVFEKPNQAKAFIKKESEEFNND